MCSHHLWLMVMWSVVTWSVVLTVPASAQLTTLSREEAGQIAQRLVQAGQFPGNIYWLSTNDLPAQREVPEYDHDLRAALAEQQGPFAPGTIPLSAVTVEEWPSSWFEMNSFFEQAYIFPLDFNPKPELDASVTVNLWTGRADIHLSRGSKTNTELGLGGHPLLSLEQQRTRALDIARTMLGEGILDLRGIHPPNGDNAERITIFVICKVDPNTGARLLQAAELCINPRTGWLEDATVINRPTTVSTTPSITEAQARDIAANYMAGMGINITEWTEGYIGGGFFRGAILPYYADNGLWVVEDGLLEQHLVWQFIGISTWTDGAGQQHEMPYMMAVNAHTGQVMSDFGAGGGGPPLKHPLKQQPPSIREIMELKLNGRGSYLWMPMQLSQGRIYIWEKYADNFGAKWDGHRLKGSQGAVVIPASEKLKYKGQWYIPLRRLCEVTGMWLWFDNAQKVPLVRAEWLKPKYSLAQSARFAVPSKPDVPMGEKR